MRFAIDESRAARTSRAGWRSVIFLITLLLSVLPAVAADHAFAERALMQGHVDEAVAQLHSLTAANPKDGAAHLLLCRAFYAEIKPDEAVAECELALQTLSNSSNAQDWMGRAYGIRADHSLPLAAIKLAKVVGTAFEAAVRLDPKSVAAADDLSEFYVGAPAMVGGGLDKATELAKKNAATLPQSSHRTFGLIAEKQHDYETAEREFRAAAAVADRPDAWVDLGAYLGRRKDKDRAVEALRRCLALDHAKDGTLVDVASVLIEIKRDPELAERALHDYLQSGQLTDAAPAFKAHLLLGKLLEKAGDKDQAKIEFGRALALAADYLPAKKAMQGGLF